jgi:hypothetical protein
MMKRVCTRLISMNRAIRQRFVGMDVKGQHVSGLILHVGKYDKQQAPINYIIQTDAGGRALVAASVIADRLANLELIASMEKDNE